MASVQASSSRCPICGKDRLPEDASVATTQGTRVVVQGRIYAVIRPEEAVYSPYKHYCTVSLRPRRGSLKYLKFRSPQEMDRWDFNRDDKVEVKGCFHVVDGKELVFDINNVVIDPLT